MTILEGGNIIPGSASITDPGHAAIAALRVASAVADAQTVTIGADVYEVDTSIASGVTADRIRLNLSGGGTVKSQGILTIAEPVTADDTITVGATTYTFKAGATALAGQIGLGGSEAATKLAIVAAINGTDTFNTANASVTASAFSGDVCTLTAIKGGVAGDLIATTETLTHASNIFNAVTLGTTTAGVDPTAGEFTTALTAAINGASATEHVTAVRVSANEVLIYSSNGPGTATAIPSTATTAVAETLAGSNNAWDTAALRAGALSDAVEIAQVSRVPNAAEVATGTMHFVFPFTPSTALVQVRTTSGGAFVLYAGAVTITGGLVTITNGTNPDYAATDTVSVIAIG